MRFVRIIKRLIALTWFLVAACSAPTRPAPVAQVTPATPAPLVQATTVVQTPTPTAPHVAQATPGIPAAGSTAGVQAAGEASSGTRQAHQPKVPGVPAASPGSEGTPSAAAQAFDGQRALAHVRYLAGDIGRRVAGTDADRRAAAYIRQQLESFGYQVAEQHFPFEGFEDKATRLRVVTPETRDIQTAALMYAATGHVTADVVAVPYPGKPEDYRMVDVEGKIALVKRGEFFLREKARYAAQAGAVAVIIANSEPQGYVGTLQEPVPIPAVAISGDDAQRLEDMLKRGAVKLQLDSDTEIGQRDGINVVGTRRGSGDGILVFGAHYDSVQIGTGADDNGSGTAVILELARVLALSKRDDTLIFVAFDGEELGLLGSRAYVTALPDAERRRIRAMLNFDELSTTDNPLVLSGSEALIGKARRIADALGVKARTGDVNGGSDHASFLEAGIPAIFFYREDPLFHTPQDTPGRVRAEWLAAAGQVALGLLDEL